jgi:hypothetical protein
MAADAHALQRRREPDRDELREAARRRFHGELRIRDHLALRDRFALVLEWLAPEAERNLLAPRNFTPRVQVLKQLPDRRRRQHGRPVEDEFEARVAVVQPHRVDPLQPNLIGRLRPRNEQSVAYHHHPLASSSHPCVASERWRPV